MLTSADKRNRDAEIAKLREALTAAIQVIKIWHGPIAWDLYYDHSPEMKAIRAALEPQAEETT